MGWYTIPSKPLDTNPQDSVTSRRGLFLSLLVTTTMGFVFVILLVSTIFFHPLAGIAYLFLTTALMKSSHLLLSRYRPLSHDPEYFAIQESVIIGGLLSAAIAYPLVPSLGSRELLYGGLGMGLLAFLSLALESFTVARERRAAELARAEAEKGRRTGDDGDLGTAQELLESALLTTEMAYGSHHPQVATITTYLADIMSAMGQSEAAGLMLLRAVKVHRAGEETPPLVDALRRYIDYLRQRGRLQEALDTANDAVEVSRRLHSEGIPTARVLLDLGQIQSDLRERQNAYQSCESAVKILENKLGRNHHETVLARAAFARSCIALGRAAEGERILTDLINQRERLEREGQGYDKHDLDMLLDLTAAQRKSDLARAEKTYARAVAVFRAYVGPDYGRGSELLGELPRYLAAKLSPALHQLYTAMASNDGYTARQLLREHQSIAKLVDSSGWTPLQWACFFGLTDLVPVMLGQGVDPGHGKEDDYPALYIAARWGRQRIIAALLGHGSEVDINIAAVDGSRPLHAAARSGHQLSFDILLSKKAELSQVNHQGWTALHEAAHLGHRKFVAGLIGEGVSPDLQAAPTMDTPLHAAVKGNSWLAVETLLLNNANPALLNAQAKSPLQLAQELYHSRVIAVLEAVSSSADNRS